MNSDGNLLQQLVGSYLSTIITIFIVNIIIQLVIGHLVAKAARMKNRSYASFYWLTLILGWHTTALIVAILPFNLDDPRHPINKAQNAPAHPQPIFYNSGANETNPNE